jgi:hypothetical protein
MGLHTGPVYCLADRQCQSKCVWWWH